MYNFQCSISFRLCLYTKKISNKKIQIVFHTFLHLVMVVNEYEHHLLKKIIIKRVKCAFIICMVLETSFHLILKIEDV